MRAPRGALHIASGVLFGVVLATGLFIWVGNLFTPGYFAALEIHVWLSWALAALTPIALGLHLERTRSPGVRSALATAAFLAVPALLAGGALALRIRGHGLESDEGGRGLAALAVLVSSSLYGDDGADGVAVAAAAGVALLMAGVAVLAAGRFRTRDPAVPVRLSGVVAAAVLLLAITTGLAAVLVRGDARFDAMAAHSLLGVLVLVFTLAHFQRPRRLLQGARGLAVLLVICVATTALWEVGYSREHRRLMQQGSAMSDPAIRVLVADGPDRGPPINPERLGDSDGCGEAGCHPSLTHQWRGSTHRFAADNDLYARVIGLLVEERGGDEARFCAGCHDPERALSGTTARDYATGPPAPGEGVSCVVCHVVIGHPEPVENGQAAYREPTLYPGGDRRTRNRRIRRDPRFHRQTLTIDEVTVGSQLCGSCHRVRIAPFMGAAVEATVQATFPGGGRDEYRMLCSDCHMPVSTPQSRGAGPLYDHHFAGINVDLPAYARHSQADSEALQTVAARVDDLIRGHDAAGRPFPPDPEQRGPPPPPPESAAPNPLIGMTIGGTRAGGELRLTITSQNERIGHAFPLGPFDLREVWQHVRVLDRSDAIVFERGAVDDRGVVDPKAHRLGATELQRGGDPLQRHRIWDIAGVRDKRLIEFGGSIVDRYRAPLPQDVVPPLRVEVAWMLRRTNLEFSRWVYGPDHPGFPVHVLSTASWTEDR